MTKVNGDDVEVVAKRGDKVISLPERLDEQDRQITWLRRGMFAIFIVLLVHAVAPNLDLFDTLLRLIGV